MFRSFLISIFMASFLLIGSMPNTVDGKKGVSVADLVTPEFFNGIVDQADKGCAGKNFYSRSAFVQALSSYPQFGKVGSEEDSKREIAAFFAHVTHETEHFCYVVQKGGSSRDYCDQNFRQEPCNPGKKYYGRGPTQLKWSYNYAKAGKSIGFDGLNSPETVAKDPVISFKTALWYWTNNVQSVMTQGFGATIRAVNGVVECDGGKSDAVQHRVGYYIEYCNELGVSPGENIYC